MRPIRLRWKILLGACAAVGVGVAILPTVASATFLRTLVREQLRTRTGDGADVGHVAVGWTTGAVVDRVRIPSAPGSRDAGRPALELEHAATRVSLARAAAAALTGGEVVATIEARKGSLYLELLPDGTTNLTRKDAREPPKPARAPGPPAHDEPIRLPCSARARVQIEDLDAEIADFTREDGTVRRTVLKGLRFLSRIHVARDGTTSAAIEEAAPTVTFDELRIADEQGGRPAKLLLRVTRPRAAIDATYFASRKETGGPAFLASARRVSASVPAIARVESDLFDALDVSVASGILDTNPLGHPLARLMVEGTETEPRAGRVHLAVVADLASGSSVPLVLDLGADELDIEKSLARVAPALAPAPGNRVPTLALASKGSAAVAFDSAGALERDATLDSIVDAGSLDLGPGTLKGSRFLERYRKALEDLGLGETLSTAAGGRDLDFDAVHGSYRIERGVATIPDLVLARRDFGMRVTGTGKLADGRYDLHIAMNGKPRSDAQKVFDALEAAGGIRVKGVVGGDFEIVTPSSKALAKAMGEKGASDALRRLEQKGKVPPGTDKKSEESKKLFEGLFERDKK